MLFGEFAQKLQYQQRSLLSNLLLLDPHIIIFRCEREARIDFCIASFLTCSPLNTLINTDQRIH